MCCSTGLAGEDRAAAAPSAAAVPVVLPPAAVPRGALVVAAVPENVAGVSFHAGAVIFDADDGHAMVTVGAFQQILLAAAIDAGKAEVVRIARQGLIALQADPLRRHTGLVLDVTLVAANLHIGNAVHPHFKGAFTAAATAGDARIDGVLCPARQWQKHQSSQTASDQNPSS